MDETEPLIARAIQHACIAVDYERSAPLDPAGPEEFLTIAAKHRGEATALLDLIGARVRG